MVTICYYFEMEIKEIRLKNARYLAESVGGINSFSDKVDKPQSFISQTVGARPNKSIGTRFARDIDKAFNKPVGWLDNLHTELYGEVIGEGKEAANAIDEVTPEALEFAKLWQELPSDQRAVLSSAAKAFVDAAKKQADRRKKVAPNFKPERRKAQ
ncbi:hypothetical protein CRENPOLYSF2_3280002 [Crenothrix polyspora]|uniref:Uncharacterized protein n=1 Tax=Crenothrix polyspora TaxID=360316 RepID=A0A1R4HBH0_9GAMM|nr:hypothetical protein [Crenothrix polyspora]SJM93381.1 hypothetical protein CRENPOLYSF2_3280002 [Crenothrix polyspora]